MRSIQLCLSFPGKGTHSRSLQGQMDMMVPVSGAHLTSLGYMLLSVRPGRNTPEETTGVPVLSGHPQISEDEMLSQ